MNGGKREGRAERRDRDMKLNTSWTVGRGRGWGSERGDRDMKLDSSRTVGRGRGGGVRGLKGETET